MESTITMEHINELTQERLKLYLQAVQHPLEEMQRRRVEAITRELPVLWDQLRRELVAERNERSRRRVLTEAA